MSASTSWNAWRLTFLPLTESVVGRLSSASAPKYPKPVARATRHLRHVRYITNNAADVRSDAKAFSFTYSNKDIAERQTEINQSKIEQYPRIASEALPNTTIDKLLVDYTYLKNDEIAGDGVQYVVTGRISLIRKSGGKLAFVDIVDRVGTRKLQVLLNLSAMETVEKPEFTSHVRLIRRGDIVSVKGVACRTSSGEISLRASALPSILSPCLHTIPMAKSTGEQQTDFERLDRHVEMLSSSSIVDTLVARSKLLMAMREFFQDRSFEEVQTPILAAAAGGAIARPFETTASEFSDRKLALRVAPELWLKRLILGGMSKIFEIGPSFRNEGLDKTHNPEFTTCEFYATYHTLKDLQAMTEDMLRSISKKLETTAPVPSTFPSSSFFASPFEEIDFIPAINSHLSQPLPDLASPTASAEILEMFESHAIPLPSRPTLPRLLDKLCSHYLEPTCKNPTWIINIPECLSPLAKSFIHPSAPNSQPVAARAELFINQREIVNCYEEENSPFEQRRKFLDQQRYAHVLDAEGSGSHSSQRDDEAMSLDEDYLRALEWGLPPTGGWGCGIDRLVMLFTGKERISDVLSFGNLRAVTRGAEKWSADGGEKDTVKSK